MGYIFKGFSFEITLRFKFIKLWVSHLYPSVRHHLTWTWPVPPFLCWYWTNKLALKTSLKFVLQIWINWELITLSVPLWHHRDYIHVLYSEWIAASHVWRMHHATCFRERANLQLGNRRLERKVKEMMMQSEEEHHTIQDQKDQVCYQTISCGDVSLSFKY